MTVCFKNGIIKQEFEKIFFDIVEKINITVHTYSFSQAKEIFKFIKQQKVYDRFENVYEKLRNIT
ncbi:MAG: hypothetical protein SNJ64_05505 [Endomicrobiia bacterium]